MIAQSSSVKIKNVHVDGLENCTSGCYFLNTKNGECGRRAVNKNGIAVAATAAEELTHISCETHPMIWVEDK